MKSILVVPLGLWAFLLTVLPAQAGSLELGGSPSSLEVDPDPALSPTSGVTVEAWVWSEPGNGGQATIVRHMGSQSYLLRQRSGRIEFVVRNTTSGTTIHAAPVGIPTGQWVHVAGTYDGMRAMIFRDGAEVYRQTQVGPLNPAPRIVRIGSGDGSGFEFWTGRLDEVRIWDHARTEAEIQSTRFAQLRNRPGLIGVWSFNDQSFQDSSGRFTTRPIGNPMFSSNVPPIIGLVSSPSLASIGSPVDFQLSSLIANAPFIFDVSLSGTSPGLPVDPAFQPVPLNPPLLNATYGAFTPGTFEGFLGLFDSQGQATARVNLPLVPDLVGLELAGAFVVIDLSRPSLVGDVSDFSVTRITDEFPVIQRLVPDSGPAAGGTPVTMEGNNFLPGMQVSLDGVPVVNLQVLSRTQASFETPVGSVGLANLRLENPDGNVLDRPQAFTYVTTLVLGGVDPVQPLPGVQVRLTGAGFQPGLALALDGQPIMPTLVTPGFVTFIAPATVACDAQLRVDNPDGQSGSLAINRSPTVTGVISAIGPTIGGGQFFVTGADFFPGTAVTVGGRPAVIVQGTSDVLLVQAPPASAPGQQPIVVTSVRGCSGANPFSYLYR